VWGHAEGNNLVILAVLVESDRVVALVTIQNEQTVAPNSTPLCVLIKVLQPGETKVIGYLAIIRDIYYLVTRY
jgi:hypothetical protein